MNNTEYTTSPGSPYYNGHPKGCQNLSGLSDQAESVEQVEFLLEGILHLENKSQEGDCIFLDFGIWEENHIQMEVDKEGLVCVTNAAPVYSFVTGEWMEVEEFEGKVLEVFFIKTNNQAA